MNGASLAERARTRRSAGTRPGDTPSLRTVRRICIFIVALATAEFLVATTGVQIHRLPRSTDFASYYLAGAQAREHLSPYDNVALAARGHALDFEYDQFPFLYPPPFALAMQPLARLPYPRARQAWMLLATLCLMAAIGATALLMRRQTERLGMKERRFYWIVLAAFVPAALNSTSVHNDVRAGSVGIVLYLALVLVAWGMMSRTSWLTGAAVALAALVKLAPAVAVLYVARRGARRAALLAAVLLVVSMLPALLHWGWGIVPDYLQSALLPSLGAEHPRPMNQSLDAMLSRLFIPSPLVRSPFDLPWLKHALSASLSIVILVLTLGTLRARRRHVALLPVELGLVILAVLILMKLTWVHTLAAMLFVWPFLMLAILRAAERSAAWAVRAGVWACIGFFLSSAHVPILWQGLRHGPWVLVISVHLLGLLILWAVSRQVLRHQADFLS